MKIIAKQNRELIMINAQNTQNENDAEKILLQVPEQYEDFNKKIVFVTPDGNVWDIITNNEYLIKKAITKYKQVDFYIWLTKGDVDFRSQTKTLKFYHNVDASGEITPEEIGRVNTVINLLEEEITKVENLESQVDGKLEEVDTAIENIHTAIQETENLDLDAEKVGQTTTITLTKKNGTTKVVHVDDGVDLQFMWQGTSLGIKTAEQEEYTFVDLQGVQGQRGEQGEPFTIKKTYSSVAEMNADFNNMQLGDYVMIASTVEVEDNAKLYTRGESQWIFITDFSGATGIRGEVGLTPNIQIGTVTQGSSFNVTRTGTNENPVLNFTLVKGDKGDRGIQGIQGLTGNGIASITKTGTDGLVDTYTITYTNGNTTTFTITNGKDGEVTETELANKVDKVQGKGLSTNDFTTEYKEKLDGLENYDDTGLREEIDKNATDIETIKKRVDLLEDIQSMEELSWKQIQAIVQAGKASTYFKIGDQIITKWKDTYANKEYEVPLDVVSFEDVTISDNGTEKIVPGMVLQWHYCSPFGVQFSQNQAFYHCNEPLPAGKYYFTIGDNWGSHCHKDYKYEFETTQTIPAGGQILIGTASSETSAMPDNNPSNWRIRTYSSPDSTTPLEILTLTKNDTPTGTFLGTLSTSTKYNTTLNNLYSSAYGHNRWKNSALRQYLNSAEDAGNWFVLPDDVFARKPDQLSNKNGFLSGVDSELLSVIKAVKVSTAINTNRDSEIGIWDYTYDKFFIPSMEQIYCNPQITGEGKYWEYWKIKSGLSSPNAQWSTNPNMITYAVENHSSAQYVRLRSASRGSSSHTWFVGASGNVSDGLGAAGALRFSPACVIC